MIKRRYEEGMGMVVDMLLKFERKQQREKEAPFKPDPYDSSI
jgi:hypothetical protein